MELPANEIDNFWIKGHTGALTQTVGLEPMMAKTGVPGQVLL